jgi:DNA transformation protein
MKNHLALADHVLDLLMPLGGVTRRYMFGGWGFYKDGLFFALIAGGRFYLKTGPCNEQEFLDAGLAPWAYKTDKGNLSMRYHEAPEGALENPSLMAVWARKGLAAAKEAAAKKAPRKPKPEKRRK